MTGWGLGCEGTQTEQRQRFRVDRKGAERRSLERGKDRPSMGYRDLEGGGQRPGGGGVQRPGGLSET